MTDALRIRTKLPDRTPCGTTSPSAISLRALHFTGAILCVTLLLQRFGLPFGGKAINLVGPIGLVLVAIFLARGALAFDRFRLEAYLMLAVCVVTGLTWHALSQSGRIASNSGGTNFQSMSQFLLLIGFAVVTFAEPVDEGQFFRRVNFWFAVVAAAGVVQFFMQFLGLGVFAFTGILPDFILFEFWL